MDLDVNAILDELVMKLAILEKENAILRARIKLLESKEVQE